MIVLHAGFSEDLLLFWAESSGGAAETRAITDALGELGFAQGVRRSTVREADAWLPFVDGGAVGSEALLSADDLTAKNPQLASQRVPALPVDVGRAIPVLAAAAGKRMLHPGMLLGADLPYWSAALRFAAGLVVRGQFLPGLNGRHARWQPVITGPDTARLNALARAMPGVARALVLPPSQEPPDLSAHAVLMEFLECATDALVRSAAPQTKHGGFDSTHDKWIYALTSSSNAIDDEDGTLAAQLRQWRRPIQMAANAPFRLCFRLEEPANEEEPWYVRYMLQANRDQSLLISAAEAWALSTSGARMTAFGDSAQVREYLLASLGQAAAIYPPIEVSLRERAPEGFTLDVIGAHTFLRESAPALEQSGYGVLLPSWWTRRGSRTRLKAKAQVRGGSILQGGAMLSLETIVEFDWKLALGDDPISYKELTALAKMKTPLVRVRGHWVEVDANEIQAAIAYLKKNASETTTAGELIKLALGAPSAENPLEVEGVSAEGWIGDLLAELEGSKSFVELPQPPGIEGTLRPYQLRGFSWMEFLKQWRLGACLADDMGLGKTIQALAVLQHEYELGVRKPVLLLCPTSVVGNWQKEAAKFAPQLPVMIHHGAGRERAGTFEREAGRHALVVSTYALLNRDQDLLTSIEWSGVILDEAQNIKNAETKQARAARALQANWRVALTGTPVENNVGDLWSLMDFLNPGFLGSQAAFKKQFFLPIQVYASQEASDRLRKLTSPFILRRLKTDKSILSDLPEKLEMKVFCTLTKEQASLYTAVVADAEKALDKTDGIERKGVVLATLSKLKQVCNHPAQFLKDRSTIAGRSGKLARLTEMLEETLEAGDRSLIFTQFREMGELLRIHLQESFGVPILFLHGGTPKKQRDLMVERFSKEEGPPIFLLSLKAGGTGLNLTRANHVFHFDRWWNPAVENQATDRAFRIGQTKNVQVHKYVCVGTLEEKIDEMIEKKKDIAGKVIGTGEGWLTELSNTELKSLFELRANAVEE